MQFYFYAEGKQYAATLTLTNLTRAWEMGRKITLWDGSDQTMRNGLISSIRVESGYLEGQKPSHFLVTLDTGREIYVRIA